MIKIYRLALSFIVLVSLSVTAHASLVTADWKVDGDGKLTQDGNGLEWLDFSETLGMSFNQVSDQLVVGGFFEGFQYASEAEVSSLFNAASSSPLSLSQWDVDNFVAADSIMNLMGLSVRTKSGGHTFANAIGGWTIDEAACLRWPAGCGRMRTTQIARAEWGNGPVGWFDIKHKTAAGDYLHGNIASWLVREEAVVPEPSIIALFGLGLFSLGFARRRRQA